MSWWMILMPAFGLATIGQAFAVRTGRSRTFYSIYRTTSPPWLRNRVFSLLPGGVVMIAGTATVGLADANKDAAATPCMLVTSLAMIVLFVWLFRPPEFMKPDWLREVERGATPEPAGLPRVRRIVLPSPVYWGLWAICCVFFVLWLVLAWPWGALVGLGFRVSTLAASTPRRGR